MPTAAPKPCKVCRALVSDGTERCADHKVKAGSFADKRRGTRHERGYGSAWDKLRAETLTEQGGLCQPHLRRGQVVPNCRIVDHIVPKSNGGTDAKSNRQTICAACHRVKSSVEALLARGLPVGLDDALIAALTPPGVVLGASAPAGASTLTTPGGGEKSRGSAARTDQLAEFSRAGVRGGGVPPLEGAGHG